MNKNIKNYARQGGNARKRSMTPAQRSASASYAAKQRWAKHNKMKNHICINICRCEACGRLKYKHIKGSEICQKFQCDGSTG